MKAGLNKSCTYEICSSRKLDLMCTYNESCLCVSGDQVLEWNGVPLTGRTYEEAQQIISVPNGEIELVVRP